MGYQRKTIQAERSNRFTVAVLIERYHVNRKNSFSWTIYEGLLTALEIRGHTGKLEDVPASDVEVDGQAVQSGLVAARYKNL